MPPAHLPIRPAERPVDAVIHVPGSKSITNRALLLAALAEGESLLQNALFSDDSYWCAESLRRLGILVLEDPALDEMRVTGRGGRIPEPSADLFVGNSGTSARFLTALAALGHGTYRLDGVARMRQRPIRPLLDALEPLGARFTFEGEAGCFPLTVQAEGLRTGTTRLDATASSQYLTALLQAAPYAAGDVTVEIAGELVSQPYIDMTLRMMAQFGVAVETHNDGVSYRRFHVRAGQRYHAQPYVVEPDASNATYFFAAAAVTGGRVRVPNLPADSLQGDVGFVEVLAQMGCTVQRGIDDQGAPYIEVRGPGALQGVDVDMNAISDTAQTLAAIAPFASGPVIIRNIGHVRHKETDRLTAVVTELRKRSVQVEERPDGLSIYPSAVTPGAVDTYDDHRMAMAFSVMGLAAPGIVINDPGCTAKTFPDYFARFEQLYAPSTPRPPSPT